MTCFYCGSPLDRRRVCPARESTGRFPNGKRCEPGSSVELHYPDGTCARWNVSNATGDRVVNMLGTPDTLKC